MEHAKTARGRACTSAMPTPAVSKVHQSEDGVNTAPLSGTASSSPQGWVDRAQVTPSAELATATVPSTQSLGPCSPGAGVARPW